MTQKHFRLLFGALTSAGMLVACASASDTSDPGGTAPPNNGGSLNPAVGAPNTGNPANPSNNANPTAPGMSTNEGVPPVTNLGGGTTPNMPATPGMGTPATPGMPSTPTTPVNTRPADVEPTDCVLPPVPTVPLGYGAATTGGGNAAPIVVTSFAEAEAALADFRAAFKDDTNIRLVLRYTGRFDFASITDVCAQHELEAQVLDIKEMENVTFEGAPGSTANFGLRVNRAKNVIIRNMTFGLLPGGGDSDAITIEGNDTNGDVENVWIDHNELFSSTKDDCPGAGDTEFDGLIDIKKGARFITVSYNYLHDHQKTGLLGFSDSDDTERYITFHHNRYEKVVSRTPLQRFGYVHLFNNYFGNISDSGINVRMGGVALIESNFFENAANPITSRFSGELGAWDLRNNHVGAGITWSPDDEAFANADSWQSTTTFPANELTYTYTPDRAGCVKQIVTAQAGAKL